MQDMVVHAFYPRTWEGAEADISLSVPDQLGQHSVTLSQKPQNSFLLSLKDRQI